MMQSFVKNVYFPLTQKIKGQTVLDYLPFLEKTQNFTIEQMQDLQWERLITILEHAAKNIPYYRNRISPEKVKSYEDFLKIPFLTKRDIQTNRKELLNPNHKGRRWIARTSGSTGLPVEFFVDNNYCSYDWASRWRGRRWFGVDIGDREVALWGRPIYSRFARLCGGVKARLQNMLLLSAFDYTEENLDFYWKKIKKFQPSFFYGYSTILAYLTQFIKEKEGSAEDLKVKAIFATGETLYQSSRKLLKLVFNCPVAIEYGCSEVGGFAYECPDGGLHISAENVFVEFLNKKGQPVKPGEIGEVVVTGLTNFYMPFIRYKIGDLGSPRAEICPCGRGLPLMELNTAKLEDVILTSKGKIFSSKLFDYINLALMEKNIKGIRQFKVYQKSIDMFYIEVIKDTEFSNRAVEFFIQKMREFIGENIEINIKFVSRIPREKTGKLRYFVSEIA
jgi:phenylacetate-CoA ligase